MLVRNNGKGKKRDKITSWSDKMNVFYHKASNRKLAAHLKAAGFKLSKKTKSRK